MKIKIALIPSEHITEAQGLSIRLCEAVEAGEMRVVDQITGKLLSLTDKDHSLAIVEKSWHQLITQVREFNKSFKSDYIITNAQLAIIIATGLGELYIDIVNIIEKALEIESVVLQLPYEEDGVNV